MSYIEPMDTRTESLDTRTESLVKRILSLEATNTLILSDEIVQKLRIIRERCMRSDKEDTDVHSWRRVPSGQHGQHGLSRQNGQNGQSGQHGYKGGQQKRDGRNQKPSQPTGGWRTGQSGQSGGHPKQTHPYVRYISKFTNQSIPVEDTILNKVILNKLNKFSSANYEEVKAFLQQILDSNESEFLQEFMNLVFKKASTETVFCPLYARMISELSAKYETLRLEMGSLYTRYARIFEEITEDTCPDYNTFVQRNREKTQRLGYSQFLAELTCLDVVGSDELGGLYTMILKQIQVHAVEKEGKQQLIEEYVDCLLAMTKAFQSRSASVRANVLAYCGPTLDNILARRTTDFPGISSKARFACMDCLDILRAS